MESSNCDACPVAGNPACKGISHRPICEDIAAGNAQRAADVRDLATLGHLGPRPVGPRPESDVSTARTRADLCRWADPNSPCGCGSEPRLCTRPGQAGPVWRADCLRCVCRSDWSDGDTQRPGG